MDPPGILSRDQRIIRACYLAISIYTRTDSPSPIIIALARIIGIIIDSYLIALQDRVIAQVRKAPVIMCAIIVIRKANGYAVVHKCIIVIRR